MCNNNIIVPVKFTSGRKTVWQKGSSARKSMHEQSLKEKNDRLRGNVSTEEVCWFGFYKWFLIWRLLPVLWRLQKCRAKQSDEQRWKVNEEKKGDSIQVNKYFPSSLINLAQSKEK